MTNEKQKTCEHLLSPVGHDVCVKCGAQWDEDFWHTTKLDPLMYGGVRSIGPKQGSELAKLDPIILDNSRFHRGVRSIGPKQDSELAKLAEAARGGEWPDQSKCMSDVHGPGMCGCRFPPVKDEAYRAAEAWWEGRHAASSRPTYEESLAALLRERDAATWKRAVELLRTLRGYASSPEALADWLAARGPHQQEKK